MSEYINQMGPGIKWYVIIIGALVLLLVILHYLYKLRRVIRWLLVHGYFFPKEARRQQQEEIERLQKTNDQLDNYTNEMEKQSDGIFVEGT